MVLAALSVAAVFVTPAFAQTSLAGNWAARNHQDWQDRGPGPEVVDMTSLPVNDDARAKALSYEGSALSLPERQCLIYTPFYMMLGPGGFSIWADFDKGNLVSWNISGAVDRDTITIWMDGRPRPSAGAVHTFGGFTTGEWRGEVLTTRTTHMKPSFIRRNGVPHSDEAVMTMHLIRHGDLLTVTAQIDDPAYLTQPYVVTRVWQLNPRGVAAPTPTGNCSPEPEIPRLDGTGTVPHHLPGQNPFVDELTKLHNIPMAATLGGAATMYPEFRKTLKDGYTAPEGCRLYCCGWGGADARGTLRDCPTFVLGDFFNALPNNPGQRDANRPATAPQGTTPRRRR